MECGALPRAIMPDNSAQQTRESAADSIPVRAERCPRSVLPRKSAFATRPKIGYFSWTLQQCDEYLATACAPKSNYGPRFDPVLLGSLEHSPTHYEPQKDFGG